MPGPAPIDPARRRRRNAPSRGEWTDLAPLSEPMLPGLSRGRWHPRTRRLWSAWPDDPLTGTYGSADVAACVELAYMVDGVAHGRDRLWPEALLRMDGLGLTPKGRRDLRLRAPTEAAQAPAGAGVRLHRLRSAAARRRVVVSAPARDLPARELGPLIVEFVRAHGELRGDEWGTVSGGCRYAALADYPNAREAIRWARARGLVAETVDGGVGAAAGVGSVDLGREAPRVMSGPTCWRWDPRTRAAPQAPRFCVADGPRGAGTWTAGSASAPF